MRLTVNLGWMLEWNFSGNVFNFTFIVCFKLNFECLVLCRGYVQMFFALFFEYDVVILKKITSCTLLQSCENIIAVFKHYLFISELRNAVFSFLLLILLNVIVKNLLE